MKICLPVELPNGLDSDISPNFRAAPALLLVDTASRECIDIDTSRGACGSMPLAIDAVVCAGGIGRGMFNGLRGRGIRVFNTAAATVVEALVELSNGRLEEVHEVACCGGGHHEHAHGREHAQNETCGCGGHGENGCGCGGQH